MAAAAAAEVSVDEKLDKLRAEVAKLDQIRRVPFPHSTPLCTSRSRRPIASPSIFADF
jgi:hypothetical protein